MVDQLYADRVFGAVLHGACLARDVHRVGRGCFAALGWMVCCDARAVAVADRVPDDPADSKNRDAYHDAQAETAGRMAETAGGIAETAGRMTVLRRRDAQIDDLLVVRLRRRSGRWRVVGTHEPSLGARRFGSALTGLAEPSVRST